MFLSKKSELSEPITSSQVSVVHITPRQALIELSPDFPLAINSLDEAAKNLLARFINQMVASTFEVAAEQLLRSERGCAKASRARQVSIYLMHTTLSLRLNEIAKIYQKDRTTIGHACRVIEELRDAPAFDDRIIELEGTIQTVLTLAQYIPGEE